MDYNRTLQQAVRPQLAEPDEYALVYAGNILNYADKILNCNRRATEARDSFLCLEFLVSNICRT